MKRLAPLFATILLLATAVVWAQQPGWRHHAGMNKAAAAGGMPQRMVAHLTTALALTEDQQAAWKPLRDKLAAAVSPLAAEARQKHQAIHAGLTNNADAATLGQLMIDAHNLGQQIRAAHDAYDKEFTALLTEDQAAKYSALKAARHARFGPAAEGSAPPQ